MKKIMKKISAAALALCLCAALPAAASAELPADTLAWPGADTAEVQPQSFRENSSGLDYAGGRLYVVDNSPGRLYVMDVADDGTVDFAPGWEDGKCILFADGTSSEGPDTEGITVDGDGYVYAASERDGARSQISRNAVLKLDPNEEGDTLTVLQQWDLTEFMPAVNANKGLESVEWVPAADAEGKLFDENTGEAFTAEDYPDMTAEGVFFAGLETNGHVYAFVLNEDGSAVLLADIDTGLGGVMALDYDAQNGLLWARADKACGNVSAVMTLDDTEDITYVAAPGGDTITHNEGFVISDITADGMRAVYLIADGYADGPLSVTWLDENYAEEITE